MITKLAVENSLYHWFNSILIDLIDENDFSVITTVDGKVDGDVFISIDYSPFMMKNVFFFFILKIQSQNIYLGREIYLFNFLYFFLSFWFHQFFIVAYQNQISTIVILWCLRIIIWVNYTHLPLNMLKYTLLFFKK